MNHVDLWFLNIVQRLQGIFLVIRNGTIRETNAFLLQILINGKYDFRKFGVKMKLQ